MTIAGLDNTCLTAVVPHIYFLQIRLSVTEGKGDECEWVTCEEIWGGETRRSLCPEGS